VKHLRPLVAAALSFAGLPALSSGQLVAEACDEPALAFGGEHGTPVGLVHQVAVTSSATIGDLHVGVEITHPWVGDIFLQLTSPAGTTVVLHAGGGGSADDLDLTYADGGVAQGAASFDFGCFMQPSGGPLAGFAGEDSAGTWTFLVRDLRPTADDGVLESLCLRFFASPLGDPPPSIEDLAGVPTVGGTVLTWTNPVPYSALTVHVEGALVASLPGTATTYTVGPMPVGTPFEVGVEAWSPTGVPACRVEFTAVTLGEPPTALTEKLVLVVIDGLRYSEGLGHPTRRYVPNMDALAAQGTIIEPFQNDGVTLTNRAVPALLSGSWDPPVEYHEPSCGQSTLHSARPTVHEYFRRQLGRPPADCPYIVGPYPCHWRASFHPSYGPDSWPSWVTVAGGDDGRWAAAQVALTQDEPTLLTLYLSDVDAAGHSGNFDAYIDAVERADQIVGELWAFLQADPEYAGRTTLIVSNDHGRHWYNFAGHGDDCYGCRDIHLLAVGPGVRSGIVSTVPRAITDITPTIGALLGFHTEFADGEPMTEILVPCTATSYCRTTPNSAGPGARIAAAGSGSIASNDFELEVTGSVPSEFGLFFYGPEESSAPLGDGLLCVSPGTSGLFRLNPPLRADPSGAALRLVDFTSPPASSGAGAIAPGETWRFQWWYRDPALPGGTGSNTSDALSVTFCP
jgi:subtilisin-like proprotein convertase family protein